MRPFVADFPHVVDLLWKNPDHPKQCWTKIGVRAETRPEHDRPRIDFRDQN